MWRGTLTLEVSKMTRSSLRYIASVAVACLTAAGCRAQPEVIECARDASEMVLIPAGEFMMGSDALPNEQPVHTVRLDAFYLDRYEVTNAQYRLFLDANPQWRKGRVDPSLVTAQYLANWEGDNYPEGRARHPVTFVSWYAAAAYAQWAGKRLPTEAEWERAARGPEGYRYAYGNEWDPTKANVARVVGDTTPVGSYAPNSFGLYDMTGNVLEWCADWYAEDWYARSPVDNPTGPEEGQSRVLRGGSWNYWEAQCTTSYRFFLVPPILNRACTDFIGFRCAMDVPEEQPVEQGD